MSTLLNAQAGFAPTGVAQPTKREFPATVACMSQVLTGEQLAAWGKKNPKTRYIVIACVADDVMQAKPITETWISKKGKSGSTTTRASCFVEHISIDDTELRIEGFSRFGSNGPFTRLSFVEEQPFAGSTRADNPALHL